MKGKLYFVISEPLSISGGFHDRMAASSKMFSTIGNLGGSGRSATLTDTVPESEPMSFSTVTLYCPKSLLVAL